ncbi:hypothetical protein Tco_1234626 [Tanacetum coccineum]
MIHLSGDMLTTNARRCVVIVPEGGSESKTKMQTHRIYNMSLILSQRSVYLTSRYPTTKNSELEDKGKTTKTRRLAVLSNVTFSCIALCSVIADGRILALEVIYAGQGSGHGNQDNYPNQDYSIGHGSAHGSVPVDDDSPVEEMLPIKSKKPSKRTSKAKKNDNNEPAKDWTTMEEITL